ncbi:AAA family ATPase [Nocardiopsis rhodophaea]|uniref:AAA family ATPase n=1 Tax=Nocardiopsis rhodophaea TaxID=280238 RepID=UPI0031D2D6F1
MGESCATSSGSRPSSGTSCLSSGTSGSNSAGSRGADTVFPASALSDGTLRFICLAAVLNLPEKPALIVLDEPELGLHPYALVQLADMLRSASQDRQVVLATQSVTLMDQFALENLIVAQCRGGASFFSRPDPERLREWSEENSLGELWLKNLIDGRPTGARGAVRGRVEPTLTGGYSTEATSLIRCSVGLANPRR